MNVYVPKNRVTLRRSGQRLESYICNVATLPRVIFITSRRWTQRQYVGSTSGRSREVFFQRRDF